MMDISQKIKELVSYHSGVTLEMLSETTQIEDDLGTTGDDAWELMEEIHQKLNVDLSGFDFTLHFAPEAGAIDNKKYGYYPVSVGHLIEVAKKKKWFMPPKSEESYIRAQKRVKQRQINPNNSSYNNICWGSSMGVQQVAAPNTYEPF